MAGPFVAKASSLPHAVARLAQADRELHFHLARRLVGHRVVDLVEPGQQAQALKDQADLIVQQQRLAKCQADPANCPP